MTEHIAHTGSWGISLILSVVASWLLVTTFNLGWIAGVLIAGI